VGGAGIESFWGFWVAFLGGVVSAVVIKEGGVEIFRGGRGCEGWEGWGKDI